VRTRRLGAGAAIVVVAAVSAADNNTLYFLSWVVW